MLGDVWRYTGQFEIGAVDHGAFTATFLRTHQILETLATQTAAIVLLTCRGKRGEERETAGRKGSEGENPGKLSQQKERETEGKRRKDGGEDISSHLDMTTFMFMPTTCNPNEYPTHAYSDVAMSKVFFP